MHDVQYESYIDNVVQYNNKNLALHQNNTWRWLLIWANYVQLKNSLYQHYHIIKQAIEKFSTLDAL